jgi:hypothetical protein
MGATAHVEHSGWVIPLVSEATTRGLAGALTGRPFRRRSGGTEASEKPDIVVAASGNLAHVSFPGLPGRARMQTIDATYPGLIDGLVRHPGIGFVMVRVDGRGSIVLGAGGTNALADGRIEGVDPIAPFGPNAAPGLRRVDAMSECGDLVIMSRFEPASGEVAAFETQVGSHGGLGGKQTDAFVLHPAAWRVDSPLIGAVALHKQIRGWLRTDR